MLIGGRADWGANSFGKAGEDLGVQPIVFANWRVARVKARTCRGLTTTTGSSTAASAPGEWNFRTACGFEHN